MSKKFQTITMMAFIGILAGGIHLSYDSYKGTSLSRLPMPAVKTAEKVAYQIPFISSVSAATVEGSSKRIVNPETTLSN